jgi:hypothetical protein
MLSVAVCCGQFSVITIHVILCSGDDGEDVVASIWYNDGDVSIFCRDVSGVNCDPTVFFSFCFSIVFMPRI